MFGTSSFETLREEHACRRGRHGVLVLVKEQKVSGQSRLCFFESVKFSLPLMGIICNS